MSRMATTLNKMPPLPQGEVGARSPPLANAHSSKPSSMRPRSERSAGMELMQMAGPMGGVEPSQAILHTSRALLVINERGWGNLYISQSYSPALALKQPGYPGVYLELNV